MQTIVVDDIGICQSVTWLCCAKSAEPINGPVWSEDSVPKNIVLNGGPNSHSEGGRFDAAIAKLLWPLVYKYASTPPK